MNSFGIVIIIPSDFTADLHICGACRAQFYLIEAFIDHRLRGCATAREIDKSGIDYVPPPNNAVEPIRFTEALDKSVIVKNEPITFKTVSSGKNGEQLVVSKCEKDLGVAVEVATLLSNQHGGKFDTGEVPIQEYQQNTAESKGETQLKIEKLKPNRKGAQGLKNDLQWGEYRGKKRPKLHCHVTGCDYASFLKKDIERHARTHTGERPFKCYMCNKMFTRSDKLQIHQRIHSGDKRYKCSHCGYAAVESGSLIKHLRVHNDQRPFKCQLCSYRSRDKSQLTVHLRMHTGDSPFVCTHEKCKGAFKTNSDLKRHLTVHSDTKAHSCPYCPFKSAIKARVSLHVQKKHPNIEDGSTKPHSCPHCLDTTFPTARKLNNHLKAKHSLPENKPTDHRKGEIKSKKRKTKDHGQEVGVMSRDYDCKQCQAAFVCQENLRIHEIQHQKTKQKVPQKISISEQNYFLSDGKRELSELENKREIGVLVSAPYLETAELDVNMRTAEMLASLADDMQLSRPYGDVPNVFFPSDGDSVNPHDSIRFIESALI